MFICERILGLFDEEAIIHPFKSAVGLANRFGKTYFVDAVFRDDMPSIVIADHPTDDAVFHLAAYHPGDSVSHIWADIKTARNTVLKVCEA